jgi:hypothetical protein
VFNEKQPEDEIVDMFITKLYVGMQQAAWMKKLELFAALNGLHSSTAVDRKKFWGVQTFLGGSKFLPT